MKPTLSICIIADHHEKDLLASAAAIKNCADQLVVVYKQKAPDKDDIVRSLGRPVTQVSAGKNLQAGLTQAIRKADGRWVFILKAGEILTAPSQAGIEKLLKKTRESAFYVSCKSQSRPNHRPSGRDEYEWLGNQGRYRSKDVANLSLLASPQVRLFRKKWFQQILIQDDGFLLPLFNKNQSSIPICPFRIELKNAHSDAGNRLSEERKQDQDYNRFHHEPAENMSQYEGFKFLAPNNFGYAMLDETYYPSILDGLDAGWGHIDILKFMLFNLLKRGDYHKAIGLSDAITAKLGDLLEVWRLRGDAFFYLLDLKNAKASYEKALTLSETDRSILFNLSKVHLIKKEFEAARQILLNLKTDATPFPEIDFILKSIEGSHHHAARLSLLMLCRDEEDYIARALDSVKDIVDEMIVVDTGSKDKTASIAKELGATVVAHPWSNHFSDARNAGLAHVTGDYVLWMDADEFLEREDQISLLVFKNILPLKKRKAITFRVESFKKKQKTPSPLPPENTMKRIVIFPNKNNVRFFGRIFESVDASINRLNIDVFSAENVRLLHISDNADFRRQRKMHVLTKCAMEELEPERILTGIPYWLESENPDKAKEWLMAAISKAHHDTKYDAIITFFASAFMQKGYLDIHSRLFNMLLSAYPTSYPVASLCANLLYHAGSYQEAADLFEKFFTDGNRPLTSVADGSKEMNDLVVYAAANLEIEKFEVCDAVLTRLAKAGNMYDAVQALRFYAEIKKRDLDKGIAILDTWIRHRRLEINETLNSMADLSNVILRIAEIMTTYRQMNASFILSRSCQTLIETFMVKV